MTTTPVRIEIVAEHRVADINALHAELRQAVRSLAEPFDGVLFGFGTKDGVQHIEFEMRVRPESLDAGRLMRAWARVVAVHAGERSIVTFGGGLEIAAPVEQRSAA